MAAAAPALEVWGHPVSQPTRAVLWFLQLNGIPFVLKKVDPLKGESKTPEFLKMNPAGTIPVLVDKEPPKGTTSPFVLFESVAILSYLTAKHPSTSHWYPTSPVERAKIDEYLHWHHGNTRTASTALFRQYIVGKLSGEIGGKMEEDVARGQKIVSRWLRIVENHFLPNDQRLFLAGSSSPSIADLTCYCELDQLEILGIFDFTPFPKVQSWMGRIKGLPKYDEAHRGLFSLKKAFEGGAAKL